MKELRPPPPASPKKPLVLGLLGGIASGKSTVAAALQAEGFVIIDADRIAREQLEAPDVRDGLLAHFGKNIFNSKGEIDRKKLATLVFNKKTEREFLENLLHPKIRRQILETMDRLAKENKAAVLDAPLLLEGGLYRLCDLRVFIHVPEKLRKKRALARGMDTKDWAAREASQASLEKKRGVSHFEIENSGPKEKILEEVQTLLGRLRNLGFI